MMTFLPYPDFEQSVCCLDNKRLGKQRVEAWQILQGQWPNHPISLMWQDYKPALCLYGRLCCEEWKRRGFIDRMFERFACRELILRPFWLGYDQLHLSHKSNLLRKDADWYSFFDVPNNLPYWYPIC